MADMNTYQTLLTIANRVILGCGVVIWGALAASFVWMIANGPWPIKVLAMCVVLALAAVTVRGVAESVIYDHGRAQRDVHIHWK